VCVYIYMFKFLLIICLKVYLKSFSEILTVGFNMCYTLHNIGECIGYYKRIFALFHKGIEVFTPES
jgi:hypothetical protein